MMSNEQSKILVTTSWTEILALTVQLKTTQPDMISWYVGHFGSGSRSSVWLALVLCSLTCHGQHFDDYSRPNNLHCSHSGGTQLDTRKVVNVVITKSFNLAPEEVQTQALEVTLPFPSRRDGLAH